MDFVDLDRLFAPLSKDKEASLEWGAAAGRKYGGWLNWDELLERQRVVLLAEALSGKTRELLFQTKRLRQHGKHAYFVRIEELADSGFQTGLEQTESMGFEEWKASSQAPAWFFLDSVDEARLNKKNFGFALRRFAKELGRDNLGRAHVIITCRASDWHGKGDRELIREQLPYVVYLGQAPMLDPDEALLAPIFSPSEKTRREPSAKPEQPTDLLVVQLVPLTFEQKKRLAQAANVPDSDEFLRAVDRSGLVGMTERPGDLIDLIGYWKEHSRFGSLKEMTEEGIQRKLTEEDADRSDAGQLTPQLAREGAERLAAALVLGKTFTLRAPGQEPDADLSRGAIEPLNILPDFTPAQVSALLRRGLFAPATYGRVRFHQRSSQEFLAASWLKRLLSANCPLEEVRRLLFVELYGVETVRPTLRTVAAWLAQSDPVILNEITRREPVSLIAHGDPKSLPIPAREKLLQVYAALDAKGELNPEMIDYRAVWLFSDPDLAGAIRQAWNANDRHDFRLQLLRFIGEAPVPACVDLARSIALDQAENQYSRMVAAQALQACADGIGLERLARDVRSAPDKLNARLAPEFALVLYPNYLTTGDLLDVIDRSNPAQRFQVEGFASHLAALFRAAPDRASARQLAFGLAELCLRPPQDDNLEAISKRHAELGKGLAAVAQLELDARRLGDVEPGLVRLLMAVERATDDHDGEAVLASISKRVQIDPKLNRALMWSDAQVGWMGGPRENPPIRVWQIGPFSGRRLWDVGAGDIDWLLEDANGRLEENERRVAFSGVYSALASAGMLTDQRHRVESLAAAKPILQEDLKQIEAPLPEDPHAAQREEDKRKRKEQETVAKQSWKDFRDELSANPEILDNPANLISWKAGLFRLHHLTSWIKAKVGREEASESARSWRALKPVFGQAVAERYSNGMRLAWRHIKAERPAYHGNGSYTTKHISILALHGLAIESAEDPTWTKMLTADEVRLATKHACFVGDSSADWFQQLVETRPTEAIEVVQRSAAVEYASEGARTDLLSRSAYGQTVARPVVAARVFQLLRKAEPADEATLDRVLQLLTVSRADLPSKPLQHLVERRLQEHLDAAEQKRARKYLALRLLLVPDDAVQQLLALMTRGDTEDEAAWHARTQEWLGDLFGHGHRDGSTALTEMSVPALLALVKLLYSSVPPQVDRDPENDDTRTARDTAEDARRVVLNALLSRSGAYAFHALQELAADPTFMGSSLRMRELAHAKAESDGDLVAWAESEVVAFEKAGTGPVKTGADLLRVVMAVLSDIAGSFDQADASSRSVLELAQDEDQVQNWLTERLNERSRGRFHVHREPKVAKKNEPDIVVSSTSANVELAIEVKNGNKGWTINELEGTLSGQLARDYLRTKKRRHGILVVSLHTEKKWRKDGEVWTFARVMDHVRATAAGVINNETGPVEVRAFALDARARADESTRVARKSPSGGSPRECRA